MDSYSKTTKVNPNQDSIQVNEFEHNDYPFQLKSSHACLFLVFIFICILWILQVHVQSTLKVVFSLTILLCLFFA